MSSFAPKKRSLSIFIQDPHIIYKSIISGKVIIPFLNAPFTAITSTSTMAADLGPLSLTQLLELNQQHTNPSSWMWNSRGPPDEDDSWVVRAFAEDTSNVMGSTWPPRSYTCTFCRREFRSAQALGGHMNVHRRDRARLHQLSPGSDPLPSSASPPPLMFPTQELVASGALCLFYPFPTSNPVFTPSRITSSSLDSPSTLLSISPYSANSLIPPSSSSTDFLVAKGTHHATVSRSAKVESNRTMNNNKKKDDTNNSSSNSSGASGFEELDLELRLGQKP